MERREIKEEKGSETERKLDTIFVRAAGIFSPFLLRLIFIVCSSDILAGAENLGLILGLGLGLLIYYNYYQKKSAILIFLSWI